MGYQPLDNYHASIMRDKTDIVVKSKPEKRFNEIMRLIDHNAGLGLYDITLYTDEDKEVLNRFKELGYKIKHHWFTLYPYVVISWKE